jgi:hypothetical protein
MLMDDLDNDLEVVQRLLEVTGHLAVQAPRMEGDDIVGYHYVIVDTDPPASAKVFDTIGDVVDGAQAIVQATLERLGVRRYIEAMHNDLFEVDEFLRFAGPSGETWLAKGEALALSASVPSAHLGPVVKEPKLRL